MQDRYWPIHGSRRSGSEVEDLLRKLGGDVEPKWDQRDQLQRWFEVAQRQRRQIWANWPEAPRARDRMIMFVGMWSLAHDSFGRRFTHSARIGPKPVEMTHVGRNRTQQWSKPTWV